MSDDEKAVPLNSEAFRNSEFAKKNQQAWQRARWPIYWFPEEATARGVAKYVTESGYTCTEVIARRNRDGYDVYTFQSDVPADVIEAPVFIDPGEDDDNDKEEYET